MIQPNAYTGGAVLALAGATDPGKTRDHNEDSLLLDPVIGLAIVADGLGGHQAGEVASAIVARVMGQQIRRSLLAVAGEHIGVIELEPDVLELIVRSALLDAHAEVLDATRGNHGREGMASTVVTLFVHGGTAVLGWVGDSPAYLQQGRRLSGPLTHSHNLSQDTGRPVRPDDKRKTLLTRVVGGGDNIFIPDTRAFDVHPGDVFLLCSDGLTDMVSDTEIADILCASVRDLEQAAQQLVQAANRAGGEDNITIALIRVDQVPRTSLHRASAVIGDHAPASPDRAAVGDKRSIPVWLLGTLAAAGLAVGAGAGWLAGGRAADSRRIADRQQLELQVRSLEEKSRSDGRQIEDLTRKLSRPPAVAYPHFGPGASRNSVGVGTRPQDTESSLTLAPRATSAAASRSPDDTNHSNEWRGSGQASRPAEGSLPNAGNPRPTPTTVAPKRAASGQPENVDEKAAYQAKERQLKFKAQRPDPTETPTPLDRDALVPSGQPREDPK